ncbi:MAG: TonB-dependent receptor [bacterium]|nr:TonB-dependent receptor [bacterium]
MVGTSRRLTICLLALLIGVMVLPLDSFAASTGQIKGKIVDKATGEEIPGVSVLVVGTVFGAATDPFGEFAILRLEPATYTLKISHIDYSTVEVTDVQVKIDQTFEVNQELSTKVTELDETITVRGKNKIIDKFVTGAQVSISQEEITTRPVQTVDALLEQVAGVQTNSEGEVFIRGSRAGEVAYIVDGVPIGDPLGGGGQVGANLSLVSGSIQEIQIIKDGFDPEYGNALSGIVNIKSQTGNKENTRINVQYIFDDLGNSDLNKYSRNFDYMRFSISGPDPLLSDKILPALGLNVLRDQEFTYYIYGDIDKNDGFYQLSDYDTPSTRRDYASSSLLGINIPERLWNRYTFQSNFKFRPRQNLKFVVSFKKWHIKETEFDRYNWEHRYAGSTLPVYRNDRHSISMEVTQAVSKDMNYEIILSMTDLEASTAPGDPNNPGKTLEPDQFALEPEWETFDDRNGNGVYDAPEPIINLFPDTMTVGGISVPAYTYGEENGFLDENGGSGGIWGNFYFNDNGQIDFLEGEPYIDLNGNGVWDSGDILQDKNGNRVLDPNLEPVIDEKNPEPFTDGDSIIGEPFSDLDYNGVYDPAIDDFYLGVDPRTNQDLNHNGKYDGPHDPWTQGIPYLDRNANGVFDYPNGQYDPGEPFIDENGNHAYDYGGTATFLDPGSHDQDATWNRQKVRTYRGEVKLLRQIGRHEVKVGFSMQQDKVSYENIERPYLTYTGRPDTTAAYPLRGSFRDFYEYAPLTGALYFRDKIEYGSMVASLGLRWDFFLQDTDELAQTLVADDRGGLIQGDRHKFSPRIGFSYPISDKAKVYFNYGHFFQLPYFVYMFARNTSSVNQNDVVGNPNLDYQKTIQYSFGVKYAMSEYYSIDIEGYFKDEFDKINPGDVYEGSLVRQQYLNKDYGRSRGFELTLEKRGGGYVNGNVSYTYAFAYGKASQTNDRYMEDFEQSREPLTESPLDNDIRHSFKAAIQVYMPTNVKPRLFGVPIPNGWSLSVQAIIESGSPYTPTSSFPNISQTGLEDIETNSMRLPGTAMFDVRFSKEFKLANMNWQAILWVENLFDSRNVLTVYTNTGRPDTQQNQNQTIMAGTEYDSNPYNWDYGRQIRVGLELDL